MKNITTKRLVLRPLELADAEDMTRLIGDWDVVSWLTSPPYPYGIGDAKTFIQRNGQDDAYAIDVNGAFAGVIGRTIDFDLGYWLGRPFQGCGYMNEAASAVISSHFEGQTRDMVSGFMLGNKPSCNVLTKLGFKNSKIVSDRSVALKKTVQVQRMVLAQADWLAAND